VTQISSTNRVKARHHMGYGGVTQAQTFILGVPAATQQQFMIENALNQLLPESLPKFEEILKQLDGIEERIWKAIGNFEANKVGNIEVNTKADQDMIRGYLFFQGALANMLLVPPNPNDMRPWIGGSGGINAPVMHG